MDPIKSSQRDHLALAGLTGQTPAIFASQPTTMRALELRAYDGVSLVYLSDKPVPNPGPGEVLVRVHSTPVTAADMQFLQGRQGGQRALPAIPGTECSGLVVRSGGGLLGRALLGRRVACLAAGEGDGTWAEYVCVPAWHCLPLRSHVGFEPGASMVSTGIAAWAMIDRARALGAKAIAHTAGDAPLGRMLALIAQRRKMSILHIIERGEQGEALTGLGATQIVNSNTTLYPEQLAGAFHSMGISVVIEANAGPRTDLLLRSLPKGGHVLVCGNQPEADCNIDPAELVFGRKSIQGFALTDWLSRAGFPRAVQAALSVQRILAHEALKEPNARLPLDAYHKALDLMFRGKVSEGQVLFSPLRAN